jgi:hypothetical protein
MSRFNDYHESFPNARLTRSKSGVLEVALHANGDTLVFNGHTHEQFVDLFHAIGSGRLRRIIDGGVGHRCRAFCSGEKVIMPVAFARPPATRPN